ncbi:hypothetical protein DPMN_190194 [Dreissena polymorpha]|uniref:Uncharacterized protein n=1 Tax=Dreissena polymorpha TaxID=45954 RepID=A0A9D4ID35_DREPO|nr:hypothetical protein DPMN_190194 [Dreissena polymorpha]
MRKLPPTLRVIYSDVEALIRIFLTMQATNAKSDRTLAHSALAGLRHLEPDHFEKSDDGPINAGFLKEVSTSRRILNTTNIIDPSCQLRCTAYMLRNKDKPVKCQLLLPTKHKLYVSGRGTIHTNCTGNCMTARV